MTDSGEKEDTIRELQALERGMWVHPLKLDKYLKQGLVEVQNGRVALTTAGRRLIERRGTIDTTAA